MRWSDAEITEVLMPRRRALGGAHLEPAGGVPEAIRAAIAGIVALLAGERCDLRSVVLDQRGVDPFRRHVHAATRAIGPGATASYGEIARAIGKPTAARAVVLASTR